MGFPLTIRLTDTKVKPWGNNGVSLLFSLASQLLFILLLSFFLSTNTKLVKLEKRTHKKKEKKVKAGEAELSSSQASIANTQICKAHRCSFIRSLDWNGELEIGKKSLHECMFNDVHVYDNEACLYTHKTRNIYLGIYLSIHRITY